MPDRSPTQPFILAADEGEALWFFGTLTTVKFADDQRALVEQQCPGGMATPLHRQPEDDESFWVLDGEATFFVGDAPVQVTAGGFVHVPRGAPHAFEVNSEAATVLIWTTPNHLAFFRAVGEPAGARTLPPQAPPDMARVTSAGQAYGVEILGPPPGVPAQASH